ncbi:MAG: tetratricopeptide repeat protein [Candidatus Omnitrophica bacterium]|nr:tetratricopeptide repeat protein [Candidatus Omnitrophota bacterium]
MKAKFNKVCIFLFFFTGAALANSPTVYADQQEEELFLVAEKSFDDGFYDVAMRYVEQFQQKYPNSQKSVQAKLLLGQCYFFKNQYLKAFEIFQSLSQYTEFRDATLFWLGETYFKGGDFKQAEKNYQQLINTYANSNYIPQGLYSLGWTYFEQTRYKDAKDIFAKLIARFPTHSLSEEAAFKMGECSHNAGEHEVAIKYFKDFVTIYPKSNRITEAYFFIAESYYNDQDYLTAVNFYAQAANKAYDPKITVLSKLGMGWSYLKLQKFDLSLKSFQEADTVAREKNIPSEDILLGLATLYADAGDNQKAGETYQKMITQYPQSPHLAEAFLGKANCDYALTKYSDAVTSYQHLIQSFAKNTSQTEVVEKAYYGLAWTYLKSGKTDLAIQSFQDIVTKSTSKIARVSALTQIADAYQEINQLDKAVEIYDQILREYPDTIYTDYAQFRQGITLLKANKIEAATLSFQSLQANFPKSKYLEEVKYYLGLAYFKKEEWEQAIRMVKAYIDDPSENKNFVAEANYLLGLANFNLKKYESALMNFQKIVKNFSQQKSMVQIAELYTAKSLFAMNKPKDALEKFTAITKLYPKTDSAAEALVWLGDYYLDKAAFPEAIEYYNQFINSFPQSEKINLIIYELGQSYQGAGRLDEALNAYKRVTENPDKEIFAKAKLAVADIFSRDMDRQTAITTYQNIAKSVPEFKKDALLRIAEIYRTDKEYLQAINSYEEALNSSKTLSKSDAASIQFEIGDTYELLHNSTKAVESYLKISYLYPDEKAWVIKSYLRLARIFEDDSKWEEAATIYKKVIVFNTDEAKYAKERLDWIASNSKGSHHE